MLRLYPEADTGKYRLALIQMLYSGYANDVWLIWVPDLWRLRREITLIGEGLDHKVSDPDEPLVGITGSGHLALIGICFRLIPEKNTHTKAHTRARPHTYTRARTHTPARWINKQQTRKGWPARYSGSSAEDKFGSKVTRSIVGARHVTTARGPGFFVIGTKRNQPLGSAVRRSAIRASDCSGTNTPRCKSRNFRAVNRRN